MTINRANQVWALDTSYIPMARRFVYLTAVVDWASRTILAHRVAITLEAVHAVEALEEAFARYGNPGIVNTDEGSQGGFNRSSQHLNRGGVYGATSGVDAEVDRA
ncbi:integrase-like protein, partial [Paraburkholderia caballeronis]|uniref:DDE-type integrase/transposase/recombinase n=1 Tax=Paraburkholderia caballeronis TaxID=416943 RepID=UPI0010657B5A